MVLTANLDHDEEQCLETLFGHLQSNNVLLLNPIQHNVTTRVIN